MTQTLPARLPERLAIVLWDFSWYTQTMPGEPFEDLDRAFTEAKGLGYNAVRICAAPLLLFGSHDLDTRSLHFSNMGGRAGQRTRWYDAAGGATLDLKEHLLSLFRAAKRHEMFVIVSSWEYQQSPAFLAGPEWYEMLSGIEPTLRHEALARAESALIDYLTSAGVADRIAYVELHNEVDLSRLSLVPSGGLDTYWAQRPYIVSALDVLQRDHPDVLSTVSYGIPPYLDMDSIPDNAQVAHIHVYVYGVLHALEAWAQVRAAPPTFPTVELRSLLRDDAPPFDEWISAIAPWRLAATGISTSMFYAYDWIDTAKWDAWLYRHYSSHELEMMQAIDVRLRALEVWASRRGLPMVIGEGWIGYTPLDAEFEDGPVGQHLAAYAVRRCIELGFWGTIVGSNSAAHHPGWRNEEFQRRLNAEILRSSDSRSTASK